MHTTPCFGPRPLSDVYQAYHDLEWCVPVHDDHALFEALMLEGAQAGLSWETILKKRKGYRRAFYGFDPERVAAMSDDALDTLLQDPGVVRHARKLHAVRTNARVCLTIQAEEGSFDRYVWGFVDGAPQINAWSELADMPATTPTSDALSKDLKRRGMTFVGSTTVYAFMQAVGLVNDHLVSCPRHAALCPTV